MTNVRHPAAWPLDDLYRLSYRQRFLGAEAVRFGPLHKVGHPKHIGVAETAGGDEKARSEGLRQGL